MYSKIIKYGVFPIRDYIRGIPITKHLRELEKTQWWPLSDISELQNEKLRALIKHAYENVAYYNKLFRDRKLLPEDIKTSNDLYKLPILTKEIIRAKFPKEIRAGNISQRKLYLHKTAGSTGEPLFFFIDRNTWSYGRAAYYRFLKWMGSDIGEMTIVVWGGAELEPLKHNLLKKIKSYLGREIILNALGMNENILNQYVETIIELKPKVLRGYASGIYLLAEFMKKEGMRINHKIAVSPTAEVLTKYQRKVIESQFNCKVFDQYGCGEVNSISFECEKHTGLHIASEHVITEFLKDVELAPNIEVGSIVITDLDNYGMPLIRYLNGDVSRLLDESCSCGRGLPLMDHIAGRTYDVIKGINGTLLYGGFLHKILFGRINWILKFEIKQYQVIQETESHLSIKIVSELRPAKDEEDRLLDILYDYLGKMDIDIEYVDSIIPGESGKRRFVISKIPIT